MKYSFNRTIEHYKLIHNVHY